MNAVATWREKLCVVLAGVALAAFAGGCVDIKVGPDNGRDDDYHEARKIDKDEAVRIARGMVRDAGWKDSDYEVCDKKTDDAYWVLFDHKRQGERTGDPYHLAVRVQMYGDCTLYRAR
jgi:hypothetical protein